MRYTVAHMFVVKLAFTLHVVGSLCGLPLPNLLMQRRIEKNLFSSLLLNTTPTSCAIVRCFYAQDLSRSDLASDIKSASAKQTAINRPIILVSAPYDERCSLQEQNYTNRQTAEPSLINATNN